MEDIRLKYLKKLDIKLYLMKIYQKMLLQNKEKYQRRVSNAEKMDFFANMGISKNVMLHYRNMDAGIHRVRKTYQVINDITEEMETLLRRWGVQGEFQVINNGYIKTNRSTMKIGKFMGKILREMLKL